MTGRRIETYPCATQISNECFPSIAVEVFDGDGTPARLWLDLRERGRNFTSLEAALTEARKVKVTDVLENGRIVFEYVGESA